MRHRVGDDAGDDAAGDGDENILVVVLHPFIPGGWLAQMVGAPVTDDDAVAIITVTLVPVMLLAVTIMLWCIRLTLPFIIGLRSMVLMLRRCHGVLLMLLLRRAMVLALELALLRHGRPGEQCQHGGYAEHLV